MTLHFLTWDQLAHCLNATLITAASIFQAQIASCRIPTGICSTDTRSTKPEDLFFALKGPRYDAHDFLFQAKEKGALGAVIEWQWWNAQTKITQQTLSESFHLWLVESASVALQLFGKYFRAQFNLPVIALTGSCGKTTVKEIIATILKEAVCVQGLNAQESVLYTEGNLNNEIGVPLMCARLSEAHRYAVFELGASHQGEIALTSNIVRPDVALLNNVGEAHLEGFGSLEGVFRAKMEIYQALSAEGMAVINLDTAFASKNLQQTQHLKRITFSSLESTADVFLLKTQQLDCSDYLYQLTVRLPQGQLVFLWRLMGGHNIQNALAAIACILPFVSDLSLIKRALEKVQAVPGRLFYQKISDNIFIIDDTYNANPLSMKAAFEAFSCLFSVNNHDFQKIFIAGDMLELGEHADMAHVTLGEQANQHAIDCLIAIGLFSTATISNFKGEKYAFKTHEEAESVLALKLKTKAFFLVKGSRGSRMEKIVMRLKH